MTRSLKSRGWDYEKLVAESKKYISRYEFLQSNETLYREAKKTGALESVFGAGSVRWSHALVVQEAKKYRNPMEFSKKRHGAYQYAKRHEMVESLFPKMRRKWTVETVTEEAKKYSYKKEMQRHCESAYNAAYRLGIMGSLFDNRLIAWNESLVREEAKKYDTKYKFQVGNQPAYVWARRNGILESLGFKKVPSAFDFDLPAYVYVCDMVLKNGDESIVFGVCNRHPAQRYKKCDWSQMSNRRAYSCKSGKIAHGIEQRLRKNFGEYRIAPEVSPLSRKSGARGEIIYARAGRDAVESMVTSYEVGASFWW